jgi:hypothetical protein
MSREAGNGHVTELLDAFRSGELEDADRARVAAHLEECVLCREELEVTGAWTDAFDRAYAARRAAAAELEPDWAAQRAAIAARTTAPARGRRPALWRWAPQIALAAVAALIVGIVWRENPREEPGSLASRASERAGAESATPERAAPAPAEGREPAAGSRRMEAPPPAAPPPAEREERFADAAPDEVAKARDEDAVLHEAVPEAALGAAQRAAALPPVERFRLDARQALAARDTVAGRRALALWSDTLAPRGDTLGQSDAPAERPAALADSLRRFLGVPVGSDAPDSPGDAE